MQAIAPVFVTLLALNGVLEAANRDVLFRKCTPDQRCVLANHCSVILIQPGSFNSLINTIVKHACGIRSGLLKICCPAAFARVKKSVDTDVASISCRGTWSDGELPWFATVLSKDRSGEDIICSGSLISQWFVLTAAGCISREESPLPTESITVLLGSVNIGEGMEYGVQYVSLHPSENAALLYLDDAVPITEYVAPICLEPVTYDAEYTPDHSQFIEAGWEDYSSEDKLVLSVSEVVACPQPSEGSLCVKAAESRCYRAEGGPLIRISNNSLTLVGVATSSAVDNRCGREPSIYTSVRHITPWILHNILHLRKLL